MWFFPSHLHASPSSRLSLSSLRPSLPPTLPPTLVVPAGDYGCVGGVVGEGRGVGGVVGGGERGGGGRGKQEEDEGEEEEVEEA